MNEYQRYGDYTQQSQERSGGAGIGTVIAFLLVGAGIGAALAMLLAPKSGSELRGAIGRGYRRTIDGVTERTRQLRERGSNLLGFNRGKEGDRQFRQG
jgi:hypothetical protein